MTHNHDRFEQRLTFARQLLNENFKDIVKDKVNLIAVSRLMMSRAKA
jgi:predicted glycosyltransferase involved in capsule biosynthesis